MLGAGWPRPSGFCVAPRTTIVSGSATSLPLAAGPLAAGSKDYPDALVELDYDGLVHLLGDAALRGRSVSEVAEVVAVLEGMVGDRVMARAMYERLRSRWRSVQALSNTN